MSGSTHRQPSSFAGLQLVEPLGAGGMGVVYRGTDLQLQRPVAVKLLTSRLDDAERTRRRFLREARSAAALNHPNICTIYRVGEVEEAEGVQLADRHVPRGTPFIAMELIEGETLDAVLARSGPLPLAQLLDVAHQIGSGLAEAHRRRIVHRDLKPGNVMVDRSGRVKILDFGLARPASATAGELTATVADPTLATVTREGTILGTVAYMSPEQLEGRSLDTRSDIFSLGVLLFELATGRHPFEASSPAGMMAKILEAQATDLGEIRGDLPKQFRTQVSRCLAKDAAERPDAATFGAISTAVTQRGKAGSRSKRSWKAITAMVGVAALAIAAAVALYPRRSVAPVADRAPTLAVVPFANRSADPADSNYLSTGIARSVIRRLDNAGLTVLPWATTHRFGGDGLLPARVAAELGVDKLVGGTFVLDDDDTVSSRLLLIDGATGLTEWSAEFEAGFDALPEIPRRMVAGLTDQLGMALSEVRPAALEVGDSANAEAWDLYLHGAEALQSSDPESHRVALQLFERAIALDPMLVEAHVGKGAAHSSRFWFGWGGMQDWDLAYAAYTEALRLDSQSMAARRGLTRLFWFQGRSEAALGQAREARTSGHPDSIETLLTQAEAYLFGNLPKRAMDYLDRVIALDPWNQGAYWLRVDAGAWDGNWEGSIAAAEDYRARFGDDAQVLMYTGEAYWALGKIDEAEQAFTRAIELFEDDPNLFVYVDAAQFFDAIGQSTRADEVLQAGLEYILAQAEGNSKNPQTLAIQAVMHALLGDREAFEDVKGFLQGQASTWGFVLSYIGYGHLALGDKEQGIDFLRQAVEAGQPVHWLFHEPWARVLLGDHPVRNELLAQMQRQRARWEATY